MSRPSKNQIIVAVMALLDGGISIEKAAKLVASYLVAERRTKELDAIMRGLLERRAKSGFYEAQVASAYELDAQTKRALEQIVRASRENVEKVFTQYRHDSSLVGGVSLETSDLRLDLTLRSKLKSLSQLTANEI